MPPQHRPPLESAIEKSLLSHLPAEVRTQIYAALLTQSLELLISQKRFIPRSAPTALFPDRCMHCSWHISACICSSEEGSTGSEFFYPANPHRLPTRSISPTILTTCRLIYREAAPLLYRGNRFHFVDPTVIRLFCDRADQRHVALIEDLTLTVHSQRRISAYKWEDYVVLRTRRLQLAQCLPHLRSAVVRLRGTFETAGEGAQAGICAGLARNLPPLEWLHVDGLTDPDAVAELKSVVAKPRQGELDRKEVREHWSRTWSRDGWINVTLWWGNPGEEPPYRSPCEPWPIGLKRTLQRRAGGSRGHAVTEEVLPYASGVGGTKAASGFL
ncbi:MAG: hypothetical protein Q9191_000958 [Dirinaria sp. TL-2023a]